MVHNKEMIALCVCVCVCVSVLFSILYIGSQMDSEKTYHLPKV